MANQLKHQLPVIALVLLGGCVYLPNTITTYNEKCQTYERHMTLEVQQIGTLSSCQGEACAGALVAVGAGSASSAIVTGSIGNVAYWLESKGQCIGSPIKPV